MADRKLKIDLNRGVRMSKDPVSQMEVYMYFDQPGVYLSPLGKILPENIAASAGYDVAKYRRMKMKQEKLAAFEASLEAELGDEATKKVLEVRNGYQLVAIGGIGMAMVLDEDNQPVTAMALPEDVARGLFSQLAPTTEEDEEEDAPKNKKGVHALA